MYKFIKKNQKKMLALFGVLLMVVFILPSQFKGRGARGDDDFVVGRLGDAKVVAADERQAKEDLATLRKLEFAPLNRLAGGFAAYQFNQHPLLYALLQREAVRDGVHVADLQVSRAMTQGLPVGARTDMN